MASPAIAGEAPCSTRVPMVRATQATAEGRRRLEHRRRAAQRSAGEEQLLRGGEAGAVALDDLHDREQHLLADQLELGRLRGLEPRHDLGDQRGGAERLEADGDLVGPDLGVVAQQLLDVGEDPAELAGGGAILEVELAGQAHAIARGVRLDVQIGELAVGVAMRIGQSRLSRLARSSRAI
jgi:hypothetical protein